MKNSVHFKLNGKPTTVETDDDRKLLWVLRNDLELTGTKYGCGAGFCGACTVIVDGKATHACQTNLKSVDGKSVTTIEGLGHEGKLHPLQQSFLDHGAYQCGYCTPGMIMNAYAFLADHRNPNRDDIVNAMNRNLCRCGAHQRIVAAIQDAATKGGRS